MTKNLVLNSEDGYTLVPDFNKGVNGGELLIEIAFASSKPDSSLQGYKLMTKGTGLNKEDFTSTLDTYAIVRGSGETTLVYEDE